MTEEMCIFCQQANCDDEDYGRPCHEGCAIEHYYRAQQDAEMMREFQESSPW